MRKRQITLKDASSRTEFSTISGHRMMPTSCRTSRTSEIKVADYNLIEKAANHPGKRARRAPLTGQRNHEAGNRDARFAPNEPTSSANRTKTVKRRRGSALTG